MAEAGEAAAAAAGGGGGGADTVGASAEKNLETFTFKHDFLNMTPALGHLYRNDKNFLKELIANASDAMDILRYKSLKDPSLLENTPELCIEVNFLL